MPDVSGPTCRQLVSVIVPTYGRGKELVDSLECILTQDYPNYEVLVVDQNPNHDLNVEKYLNKAIQDGRIRYLVMDHASSPESRNVGVKAALGEIILLVDDDVLLKSDWITRHVRHFTNSAIGAVVGRIIYPPQLDLGIPGQPTGVFLRNGYCTAGFGRRESAFIDTGGGGNMSVRRDLYLRLGGYDELFTGNAFREESDFALRLRRTGNLIFFDPEAEIIHLKSPSGGHRLSSPGKERVFHDNLFNETRFFLKNFPHADLPKFLWRFKREIIFPAVRMGLHTRRVKDAFPAQLGLYHGWRSYLAYPQTVATGLNTTS